MMTTLTTTTMTTTMMTMTTMTMTMMMINNNYKTKTTTPRLFKVITRPMDAELSYYVPFSFAVLGKTD